MDGYQRFLSERDQLVFAKAGYGGRVGFGARPIIYTTGFSRPIAVAPG
jgi:hypothetical protein